MHIGLAPANLPGVLPGLTLLTGQNFTSILRTLSGTPGVAGAGWVDIPFPVTASMVGIPFYHQMVLVDPGTPGGYSATNGLEVRFGLER